MAKTQQQIEETNKLQDNAISLLEEKNRLILSWSTGVGKGTMAVKAIKKLRPDKVLILVAEVAHKKNWREELIKWKVSPSIIKNITIACHASLKKYIHTSWDLLILDEVHHFGTETRLSLLHTVTSNRVLCLSATLNDKNLLFSLNKIFGRFEHLTISTQKAIDNNLLPEPTIVTVPLSLNRVIYNQTIIEEWGRKEKRVRYKCRFEDRWKYLSKKKYYYTDCILEMQCTEHQKYVYLTEQFNYWRQRYMTTRNQIIKNKWLQCGSKRKRFLGELKTNIAKELLSKIQDKRYICFCSSIEQAEILGGENAVHSKSRKNKQVIDSFNNKETNKLYAIGMLQEGMNLSDIEVGVIIQLDGTERPFLQRLGRVFRAEEPIQYILYYRNTRDEEYLKDVLKGLNPEYIKEQLL